MEVEYGNCKLSTDYKIHSSPAGDLMENRQNEVIGHLCKYISIPTQIADEHYQIGETEDVFNNLLYYLPPVFHLKLLRFHLRINCLMVAHPPF